MKRTTIKDIARQLGVNPSTVSRALKDHPDIGFALRQEIKKLADAMHYRPNPMAVQLRQRQSKVIGLIVPEMTMFFYPSVIKGIHEVIEQSGYHLMMLSSNESPERELENIRICAENGLAGILVAFTRHTGHSDALDLLLDVDIPVVMFDKVLPDLPFDAIVLADSAVGKTAVNYLAQCGCKSIGGLFGNPNLLITQRRMEGFKTGLHEAGLKLDPAIIRFADDAFEAAVAATELMNSRSHPDGIFIMSDELLMGALPPIVHAGLVIPGECSVICISDGFLPQCLSPKVTYLHHDGFEIGQVAAQRLLRQIETGEKHMDSQQVMLHAKLVRLETT